ncbi:MAG: class I SAM-dependent methyltransferase [Dehalococcoidia bacterium]
MTTQPAIDEAKGAEFVGKVLSDVGAGMMMALCAIGDRLGLFKDLAEKGPATSIEFAARAGINERYAREWLGGMAAAGYLEYDRGSGRFTLPPEHAPVLVQEAGPVFFGGIFQMLPSAFHRVDRIAQAFNEGGGVTQSEYGPNWWEGMERFTAGWFENFLLQEWIPAMPEVKAKLEQGALVADVGSGSGRALFKLAEAFPNSSYVGYDISEAQVERAHTNAREAGLGDKVHFRLHDVVEGLPEQYDVITTFDVIHDAIDPRGLLRAIREGIKPGGYYVCLDINCSDKLEENVGPLGTLFHGFSVLYCMTTSLAHGGEGLGTLGFHERMVREMCQEAGFSEVRRLPLENPFNNVYEVRA